MYFVPKKSKVFFKKNKEIILYLIFGCLTTLVSIASYYILTVIVLNPHSPLELQTANVISWIISVSFAFITNKMYVFKSNSKTYWEILKFFTSRLGTLAMEASLMYLLVSVMKLPDLKIKIAVQAAVIILNYILSKLIVFKKQ